MEISISIITCFSPNYVVFTVLRTINGFTFPAIFQIPFILSEYFPLANRETGREPIFEFSSFGNDGTWLSHLRRDDDMPLLRRRTHDTSWSSIHLQLVVWPRTHHLATIRPAFQVRKRAESWFVCEQNLSLSRVRKVIVTVENDCPMVTMGSNPKTSEDTNRIKPKTWQHSQTLRFELQA